MLISNAKATMFFSNGKYGWSETHYCASPNPISLSDLSTEVYKNLTTLRARLLGLGSTLDGYRVSYHQVWRDALSFDFSTQLNGGAGSLLSDFGKANPSDNPYYVTTVRLGMTPAYRKLVYVSGMPASQQPAVPLSGYDNDFDSDFKHYFDYLCGKYKASNIKWGTLCKTKNAQAIPQPNVFSIIGVVNDAFTFTVAPQAFPAGLTVGMQIRLLGTKMNGAKGRNPLNGTFTVTSINGNPAASFTIKTKKPFLGTSIDYSQAYYWVIDQQVQQYTDWSWENQTEKKRGPGSTRVRGRS